jgi:antitoxin component YwqK of YwqJK toxin-antitoxin module
MTKQWIYIVSVLLYISCTEKPKPQEIIAPPPTAANQATTESNESSYADLPSGAIKEEFQDTPDVVKITVGKEIKGTYKSGKRNGSWVEYHPNGLIKTITSYVDGKKEGLFVELNNNGQLQKRIFYHNDTRHGEYKEFNFTNIKEERYYQYDKLQGTVKIFYDNGRIMEEGNYKDGTRDGTSKWYDQNGNVTITYEYRNGELVKK